MYRLKAHRTATGYDLAFGKGSKMLQAALARSGTGFSLQAENFPDLHGRTGTKAELLAALEPAMQASYAGNSGAALDPPPVVAFDPPPVVADGLTPPVEPEVSPALPTPVIGSKSSAMTLWEILLAIVQKAQRNHQLTYSNHADWIPPYDALQRWLVGEQSCADTPESRSALDELLALARGATVPPLRAPETQAVPSDDPFKD